MATRVSVESQDAPAELVFANARIVLPDGEIDGSLCVREGTIADIATGPSGAASAIDCDGDYLVPGLVDLHTDNLEKHFTPRPGVDWPGVSAVLAHDGQVAAAGITTVFDALALGSSANREARKQLFPQMVAALSQADSADMLRADHFLHMRCEVTEPEIVRLFALYEDNALVRFVSVMDHSPGQRQFADLDGYRRRMRDQGMAEDELEEHIAVRARQSQTYGDVNRAGLAERGQALGLPMASHDDGTEEQIAQSASQGMNVAEFPTTLKAAEAARTHGMAILGGAPNVVRGGSYTGNVSMLDLWRRGLLDMLSSDYMPVSMMDAAFKLAETEAGCTLSDAIALVSANPARAAGLDDRGEIALGRRADLVRVRRIDGVPVVRAVWRAGRRIG